MLPDARARAPAAKYDARMLRHCALFRWADDTTEEQKRAVFDALARLPRLIPEIVSYTFGPDLRARHGNHDFGVVADFADVSDFQTYSDHPEHQAVVQRLIIPAVTTRVSVQFEL